MAMRDPVNVVAGKKLPDDYHCRCADCKKFIGELRPADGSYYSRLERRKYYAVEKEQGKGGHIAKTPLHIARWAIQQYSKEGDWVLDPTIGAGTTMMEALTQGRSAAGMELEYGHILKANVEKARGYAADFRRPPEALVAQGDARNIGPFLKEAKKKFSLVVNNPPYSGDVSMPYAPDPNRRGKEFRSEEITFFYDPDLPNLAFLREGQEYWETLRTIYGESIKWLKPGGHFVIGVKDMMRNKEPFLLHKLLSDEVMRKIQGVQFVGTALLKHHPGTLFLRSYGKRYGVEPPQYQTITVFKKA